MGRQEQDMTKHTGRILLASVFLIAVLTVSWIAFFTSHDGIIQTGKVAKGSRKLPCLVDVGADYCPPCVMMMPILEELKKEYAGVLIIELVDAGKNPEAGQQYGVRSLPTQIFYDANGKELKRHIGFLSKQEILDEFQKLGISLKPDKKTGT